MKNNSQINQTEKHLMNTLNEILDEIRYYRIIIKQNELLLHPQLELRKLTKELNKFINLLLSDSNYKTVKTFLKKFNKMFYHHSGWEKENDINIKNIKNIKIDYLGI